MTQFSIGSRANDAWDFSGTAAPARPSNARMIDLPGRAVTPGDYRWVAHAADFVVGDVENEPTHQRLIEHLGADLRNCVLGTFEVNETENGLDVVFEGYEFGPRLGAGEITDRIEAWARAGAPVLPLDDA